MTSTLRSFLKLTENRNELFDFLFDNGVLLRTMECPKCGNIIQINLDTLEFFCRKRFHKQNSNRKRISVQCNFKRSARQGTWFSNSHLSIQTACEFVAYFVLFNSTRQDLLQKELKLSSRTVVDWANFCREVCIRYAINHSEKLGGEGIIVEIDEAKFGKRKYHRGRLITGKWVFGGIERDSKKIFLVPVPDRTATTLLNIIKTWIHPGTTIMSDCWKAYDCLNSEDFRHFTVNHSVNFVDPTSGAHTQNIERVWRDVRSTIPRYGSREEHLEGYLAEFLFKRLYKKEDRILAFFKAIAEVYPPGQTPDFNTSNDSD